MLSHWPWGKEQRCRVDRNTLYHLLTHNTYLLNICFVFKATVGYGDGETDKMVPSLKSSHSMVGDWH